MVTENPPKRITPYKTPQLLSHPLYFISSGLPLHCCLINILCQGDRGEETRPAGWSGNAFEVEGGRTTSSLCCGPLRLRPRLALSLPLPSSPSLPPGPAWGEGSTACIPPEAARCFPSASPPPPPPHVENNPPSCKRGGAGGRPAAPAEVTWPPEP